MLNKEDCIEATKCYRKRVLDNPSQIITLSLHEINSILEYLQKYQEVEKTVKR